jgi:MoaA/NifB/PqqE/SkfB family radical SAM enzyme
MVYINNKESFTSANSLPIKLIMDRELFSSLEQKIILPRHVQVSPTNVCNLNCTFCSCRNRNKAESLTSEQLDSLLKYMINYHTAGVTITGGGEPALYPHINNFIDMLSLNNIKIGLVSNGTVLKKLGKEQISSCKWIRISFGDDRIWDSNFIRNMEYMRDNGNDLAFSYVVSNKYNFNNLVKIISFANNNNFTHIRLVSDIYNPDSKIMEDIKYRLSQEHIDDSLIIYQSRERHTKGASKCLISLLKPLVAADGNIYPCCGVQYSLNDENRTFPEKMIMGKLENLEYMWGNQKYFNGSICEKCYYTEYNYLLNTLMSEVKHKEFV